MSRKLDPITISLTEQDRREFIELLQAAYAASEGGSNDGEISALWDVAAAACGLLDTYRDEEA